MRLSHVKYETSIATDAFLPYHQNMDKNCSELFGNFAYAESLTYEALLAVEDSLIVGMEDLLLRAGAEHVDFTPLGDSLMLECEFEQHKLYVYRKIAMGMAAMLPEGVSGRLLCLHRDFSSLHAFWLRPGQWMEEERSLPETPPDGLTVHAAARVALASENVQT